MDKTPKRFPINSETTPRDEILLRIIAQLCDVIDGYKCETGYLRY